MKVLSHANPVARSGVYECVVRHERFAPRRHAFTYRLFYLALDLDELPTLNRRLRLFSSDRANVLAIRSSDYLPLSEALHNPTRPSIAVPANSTLKDRALAFCRAHGIEPGPHARVLLVTLPRILGYHFNPVSFYFCLDQDGAPRAAIAEVTNTFRETKPYFVPVVRSEIGLSGFQIRIAKEFYVSPFSGVDLAFDFSLRLPTEHLAVQIDDYAGAQRTLHSTLVGDRTELTDLRLGWLLIKYPLMTLKVITLIHWEAFRLWAKRLPFFRKTDAPAQQRDLYRPHLSVVPRTS